MKKFLSIAAIVAFIVAMSCQGCKSKSTDTNDSVKVDSVDTSISDSTKHTVEYIKQRIDTIYKYKDDKRFCSSRYLEIDAKAAKLSKELDCIYIDSDHWICGQDIDPKWNYRIKEVKNITDSTAVVELVVHNFNDERVILDLWYERNDWFVDDFHVFFSDDGHVEELIETDEIIRFIHECHNIKVENKYGKNFNINKYLPTMNKLGFPYDEGGDDAYSYNQYALVDIDLDGKPEVCVRNEELYASAVFSITGDKPKLLTQADSRTDLVIFERGVGAQGSCGTGCHQSDFCTVENSNPVDKFHLYEQYDMGGKLVEKNYTLNNKNISEQKAKKILNDNSLGRVVRYEINWKPIDLQKKSLSTYAE